MTAIANALGFRRRQSSRTERKQTIMPKLSLTTVAPLPAVKPTSKAKGAFPLDAPKKGKPAAVSAKVAPPPVIAAIKETAKRVAALLPETNASGAPDKLRADVLFPAAPGMAKEAAALLASLSLPAGDRRAKIHGTVVKARLFMAKRGNVSVVEGPGRTAMLLRLPDGMAACAAGYVSVFWGEPGLPLNPARLSTPAERAMHTGSYDLTWEELAALVVP